MFAITNPIGNTGIFISMVGSQSVSQQRKTAFQVALSSFIILLIVTFCGKELLGIFGIDIYAFQLAGGLIILVMGMHMLQSKKESIHNSHEDTLDAKNNNSIAVVPMSLPLIAGPGAMTAVIVHAAKANGLDGKLEMTVVNLILMIIVFTMLFFSPYIKKLLGESGLKVVTKVMGMILAAMAFMMLGEGVTGLVANIVLKLS
jgi:multiple antibiotic resistance protein